MKNKLALIDEKKKKLDAYRPFSVEVVKNLNEWFKIELTYTSNAIEGNTLSRAETTLIVEKGLTVEGKTLQEHLEAINHAKAFEWITQNQNAKDWNINEKTVLDIHRLILQRIDDANAGRYRTIPVRIAGSTVIMPNAIKVSELMKKFVIWIKQNNDHPVTKALDVHFRLVSIHPFVDGNGRTARLLMNLLLMQAGFPPAIVRKEDRNKYITSIEKAQLGSSLSDYYSLMCDAVNRSLDIYLDTMEDKKQKKLLTKKPLLKIGQLAKLSGETVPTIRHWTKEGLLGVEKYTKGGYQLYDQSQLSIARKIRKLQNTKRLTLSEIKKHIN